MLFSLSPVWTLRRRMIAGVVGIIWLCIAGILLMGLTNNQPTEITYQTDDISVTLRTDKRFAVAAVQCIQFSWEAYNVDLLEKAEIDYVPAIQPSSGEREACHSEEARVIAAFDPTAPDDLKYLYPQTTWINPAALIFIGMASFVTAILLWQPAWLGPLKAAQAHLISVPLLIILVLMTQVIDPLGRTLQFIPVQLFLIIPSGLAFILIYLFRKQSGRLFVAACSLMIVVSILFAAYRMFTVPGMLNQDEGYYASIAATGSAGFGLYPYTQNYPPMPVMGGIGHMAWLHVAAYSLFGPTIWGLRLVALVIHLLGLPAIFMLFRRWYGTATAWMAVALIPTTFFYVLSYSARMDTMTLTWIWWGLLLVDIARKNDTWRWHLAAGLFMGLGLQAHIDTSITTIACGILYLADYAAACWRAKRLIWPRAVIAYSIGALTGLGVYVVINILPNPDAFLRTAGSAARLSVVNVDETLSLPERVLSSFLALESFFKINGTRVLNLFLYVPTVSLVLGFVAFATLFTRRRSPADHSALILFVGIMMAGFFILNGPSLYYTMHIFPVAILCLPSFFTHGYLRRGPFLVSWQEVNLFLLMILLPLVFPLYSAFSMASVPMNFDVYNTRFYTEQISTIQTHVSHECILLGPAFLYEVEFMAYPRYNTLSADGGLGLSYHGFQDGDPLWPLLNPDIVFERSDTTFGESLQAYIQARNYQEIGPNIWQKTHEPLTSGCVIDAPEAS